MDRVQATSDSAGSLSQARKLPCHLEKVNPGFQRYGKRGWNPENRRQSAP